MRMWTSGIVGDAGVADGVAGGGSGGGGDIKLSFKSKRN